jgi:hypothetical protein
MLESRSNRASWWTSSLALLDEALLSPMADRNDSSRGPSRRHLKEARRLIDACAKNTNEMGAIADAVNAICSRLTDHLEPLIGRRATQALFARAVHLSKPKFKMLDGISTAEADIANVVQELSLQLRAGEPGEALEAVESILGNFVWLLTYFISEDFGLRLLRESCPDLDEEQQ